MNFNLHLYDQKIIDKFRVLVYQEIAD